MCATTAGYSGTPLARKLGIVAGSRVVVLNAPGGYRDWLAPLPDDVRFAPRVAATTTLVHLFVDRRDELQAQLDSLRTQVAPAAAAWVSWPKKAARVPTDVTEDVVRTLALPLGFVDVKVCAVNRAVAADVE